MIDVKEYSGKSDLTTIDVHKLILLVGAGVSIKPPTKLPSGQALTQYYLESCIGSEVTSEIMKSWERINEVIYKSNGFEIPLVRLEFIIGCINDVDIEFNYFPFIAGFQQFVNVNSNENHIYLKRLKNKGCEIITPNFDCAIEKLYGNFRYTTVLGVPSTQIRNNIIYHYHGIGTQYEQLGATISKIKQGVNIEFGKQIKNWFEKGYSIISVGFSCSDYFDMTPFFESLPNDTYEGTAIFFQHGDTVDEEIKNKISKFYGAFKNRKIIYGDTTAFLEDLNRYAGGRSCIKNKKTVQVDWKVEFEHIKNCRREKLFYLIKLLNHCGLTLSDDFFRQAKKSELINRFDSMGQLLEYAMEELKDFEIKEYLVGFHDRSKSIFSDIIDLCIRINYSSENFCKIESGFNEVTQSSGVRKEEKAIKYNELIEHIRSCDLDPKNFITIYVYAFKRLSKERIINILKNNTIITCDEKIKAFYECSKKMMQLPFYEYEYISYYLSISRIHNILCIMLEKEINIEKKENHMLNIALEICGLSLVINTYINTMLLYIMLFAIKGDWDYYNKAVIKMQTARKCINITGNQKLLNSWEEKHKILQQIKEKYKSCNSFDYSILADLIQIRENHE